MNIRGLIKTSLIDFPGKISSVIFVGGCNLRCVYCHNPDLVLNSNQLERVDEAELFGFLKKRKNLIDGVTISGGEPTLDKELISFLQAIRSLNLLIKLDTNGLFPDIVEKCIKLDLLDYVAIDVKTSPEKYPVLTGRQVHFSDIVTTIHKLSVAEIPFEIRTTCVPGFVTVEDIRIIGRIFGRIKNYYLQQYVNRSQLINEDIRKLTPYPLSYIYAMRDEAVKFTDSCGLRGI